MPRKDKEMTLPCHLKKDIFTIPNILTLFRIVLAPMVAEAFWNERGESALFLFALSCLSDVLDGFIARRFHMVSEIGKVLDPVADKITFLILFGALSFKVRYAAFLFVLLLVKELYLAFEGILVVGKTGRAYGARWYGKVSAFFLYALLLLALSSPLFPVLRDEVMLYPLILATGFVLLSFFLYSKENKRQIAAVSQSKKEEETPI